MRKPNRKTVRAAIRGSVPDGKLRKAKIKLSDAPYQSQSVTGFTEYGTDRKTVVKIGAPDGDSAIAITVRGHESRHATHHTKGRAKNMSENEARAAQIVDDVNIETLPLPSIIYDGIETYRRAHIATAMTDLRSMLKSKKNFVEHPSTETFHDRNQRLAIAMRVKAMLAHYRQGGESKTIKQALKGSRKLKEMIGRKTSQALHQIIQLAKMKRGRARAIAMLAALMETEPEPADEREHEEKQKGELEGIFDAVPHGSALEGQFRVIDLRPKSVYTAKERRISMRYTPDGVHLNPSRYVSAIVSGDANGMFSRRVRQKAGGTVVIDASGSMSANRHNLTLLARAVPTATIAYYSGNDAGKGVLAVYADKGLRFNGQLPENTLQGGNAVDLAAIRWMMQQPKPWTFVSDLGFTGGVLGSEVIAHSLIERGKQRGDITHYSSLDEAYEVYTKGRNLGEDEANLVAREQAYAEAEAKTFKENMRKHSAERKRRHADTAKRIAEGS